MTFLIVGLDRKTLASWHRNVRERDDMVGMDGSIIMNRAVWKASGHEETFSDPMVDCLLTKVRFRADQVPAQSGTIFHFSGAHSPAAGWKSDKDFSVLLKKGDNVERARKVAKRIRSGQVRLNGAKHDFSAPFGGYKYSGNGREFGVFGMEEYLEAKSICGYFPA